MPNYQLGKIYKIVDTTNNNIYIGSTCEPTLARRLAGHVRNYKNWKIEKHDYTTSFKIMENDNYDIVLLENCPCETKDELHKRERYYIESLECVNRYIVGRTYKEYYEANKEKIKEYKKSYNLKNRIEINEKSKQHYEEIKHIKNRVCLCECGVEYTRNHQSRHQKSK